MKLRLRRYTYERNQLFLSFNPIDVPWLEQELKSEDVDSLGVTYKDNRFITQEYIDTLEALKDEDETYYKIYTLGQFARVKGLIFDKWDIVKELPEGDVFYGLDFGFNHPTALVKVVEHDGEMYVSEALYQTKLTNSDLIDKMKPLGIGNAPIYCDSAEPNRIEELARAGFNTFKARKEVRDGIDVVKSKKLHILETSTNLIDELRTYKWKEKRNGETLDEPVKFHDDACDALRYAVYTHDKHVTPSLTWI